MLHGCRIILIALAVSIAVPLTTSADLYEFPPTNPDGDSKMLTVFASMDISSAKPLIEHYLREYPGAGVAYHELDTLDIYARVVDGMERNEATADVLLSPAMDLQVKLANDGYIRQYRSNRTGALPKWSQWRNEVFGFSFEPAVIVYNKQALSGDGVPTTRDELRELLREKSELLDGRVATYDIERSGLGFLFLTQDAEQSRDIWQLVGALGNSSVKLYTNTAAMLDLISSGRFVLGYNLLGSYALRRAENDDQLGVILPQDYTLAMIRTAVLPRNSREPELANQFLDFLLSTQGQSTLANQAGLYALHADVTGEYTAANLNELVPSIVPIRMSPALMVYLDRAKRQRVLGEWQGALSSQ
ncbi:MAG: ABC transporter substrate-binding protein [Xanthomonadales bacterium]|nr:ABC transporter substrate-binding protein [Xanthomonadales bacterium]